MNQKSASKDKVYEDLQKFGVEIETIKKTNPTGKQLEDLRNGLAKLVDSQRLQALKINHMKFVVSPMLSFSLGALAMYHGQHALNSDSIAQSIGGLFKIASMYGPSQIQCAFETGSCNIG